MNKQFIRFFVSSSKLIKNSILQILSMSNVFQFKFVIINLSINRFLITDITQLKN